MKLEARAYRTDRMGRFDMPDADSGERQSTLPRGETLPGHEFHYWESTDPGRGFTARAPIGPQVGLCPHFGPSLRRIPAFPFCIRPESRPAIYCGLCQI